jgi:hypothetical protein
MAKTIAVKIPVGRPAYIQTSEVRYDAKGCCLGREVILVQETFSTEEAKSLQQILGCPECGGIGEHKSYFVQTGQNPAGSVEGYTKQCSLGADEYLGRR